MTTAQHTPGPWSASLDMDGRHHHLAIMTDAPAFKEEEWPYHPKLASVLHGLGHADRKTAEANARLIAAAPELLDALYGLLWPWDNDDLRSKAETKARAAIMKAKGKQVIAA